MRLTLEEAIEKYEGKYLYDHKRDEYHEENRWYLIKNVRAHSSDEIVMTIVKTIDNTIANDAWLLEYAEKHFGNGTYTLCTEREYKVQLLNISLI